MKISFTFTAIITVIAQALYAPENMLQVFRKEREVIEKLSADVRVVVKNIDKSLNLKF